MRQPYDFLPREEAHGQDGFSRLFRTPCAVDTSFDLKQRQTRVIKEFFRQ